MPHYKPKWLRDGTGESPLLGNIRFNPPINEIYTSPLVSVSNVDISNRLDEIEEKVDSLIRKLDLIFGDHIIYNERLLNIRRKE